ncbi:uncharacterized protein [Venturia canescens]|uniref:uncharacterized protein n=1 Tax=Venturia canescens TaxID=32260 RepID=UPI001C9BF7DF|nr:uncharacterized protein LOC122405860 [Venturia canescens]
MPLKCGTGELRRWRKVRVEGRIFKRRSRRRKINSRGARRSESFIRTLLEKRSSEKTFKLCETVDAGFAHDAHHATRNGKKKPSPRRCTSSRSRVHSKEEMRNIRRNYYRDGQTNRIWVIDF